MGFLASEHYKWNRFGFVSRIASGLLSLLGGVVLFGWLSGFAALVRVLPAPVAMSPFTALSFVCLGLASWRFATQKRTSAKSEHQYHDWFALALALFVALTGALRLTDYLFGLGLPLERLLLNWRVQEVGIFPPSELAPNTALNFLLAGVALVLLWLEPRCAVTWTPCLVLVCGAISLLALIGYTYRILLLYRVGMSVPMALDSAIGFTLFTVAFFAARPRGKLMSVLTSKTTGGAVARRLIPVAILIPWGLGAMLLLGEKAGYYGRDYAISIFAVSSIVIFTGLIWWNSRLLYEADLERMQAEEQLRKTSENLERSNGELQQFAYAASHDLFEPLRMVVSYLQLLNQRFGTGLVPQAREFIGFAVDGAERMQALIQDLLAYSRVDMRGGSFNTVDCEQAFSAAVANLKVAIEETGAVVRHGQLPRIAGDSVQIAQVFQNLIGNALKFHGNKPPEVDVAAQPRGEEWLFYVRDNGIGIEPRNFERIFVIFQRLHTRTEYAGTGIGLALCKKIIERHGGKIWVESIPGKGSTFLFTLPKKAGLEVAPSGALTAPAMAP